MNSFCIESQVARENSGIYNGSDRRGRRGQIRKSEMDAYSISAVESTVGSPRYEKKRERVTQVYIRARNWVACTGSRKRSRLIKMRQFSCDLYRECRTGRCGRKVGDETGVSNFTYQSFCWKTSRKYTLDARIVFTACSTKNVRLVSYSVFFFFF